MILPKKVWDNNPSKVKALLEWTKAQMFLVNLWRTNYLRMLQNLAVKNLLLEIVKE